ncbi:MAG: HAMP domain-containing protein [Acidimicrobiia bacterium]|nr:HAMP domain-containing protein [Acidimicrobiia bacterium]MDH5503114.1 HAMP domain-containing protein [Acidimicrobiia bacterium]
MTASADPQPPTRPRRDPVPALLRPFVDFVAKIQARLETKLLGGFLVISVLMLALGVIGLLAVNRMDSQVDRLSRLSQQTDNANHLLYSITAQSHFRTMALLTGDPVWTEKIVVAKANFVDLLDDTEAFAVGDHAALFASLRSINERYGEAGVRVEAIQAEDSQQAILAHIQSEHEISHELEDLLNEFIASSESDVITEINSFAGDRQFLTVALAAFSAMSLLGAIALGAIISWTVIGPVRKIDHALDTIASGDFTARVEVANRDEFGTLSDNVNRASEQLETLYGRLETVNRDLQATVDEQVAMLEHASVLRRYLSPQVADAIIAGTSGIGESRRAELTVVFADVRGFTALSEQAEPEEMIGSLNQFLSAMTDVVFRYEGTLDKYIGDALMIFFNDPLPQEDHAERAVRMALDMQTELTALRTKMSDAALMKISAGIGISTGFVTVGNVGSPSRMDYTVIGNHVNLASRLADDAGPGEILISERTLALLPPGLVISESAGERNLKGVQRPIALYRVTAAAEATQDA